MDMATECSDFVIRLASVAILARILMPEYFGLLSMVTAITSVGERFKDLGLSNATIQKEEITQQQVSSLFWLNAAVGMVMRGWRIRFRYSILILARSLLWPRLLSAFPSAASQSNSRRSCAGK
jgi:hypothetical protein